MAPVPAEVIVTESSTDSASRRHAARIWAAATAFRDGDPAPATADEALPIIDGALTGPGAALLLAERDGCVVGFALLTCHEQTVQVQYLGVDPAAWGSGVGAALLTAVASHAARAGARRLELWVYEDNDRAVSLYLRAGWNPTDEARQHRISQRRERRYILPVPDWLSMAEPPRDVCSR